MCVSCSIHASRKADGSHLAQETSHTPLTPAPSVPPEASSGSAPQASSDASKPKDPAQALKEKLAALAQMQQASSAKPPANKRFKKAAKAVDDKPLAGGDSKSASAYLEMVRKLKGVEKEGDGVGGKWLVR